MKRKKMLSQDEIIRIVNDALPYLKRQYGVKTLSLFGSYSRGDQTGTSDIDMLVEFHQAIDLIDYIKLENDLRDLLGCGVDLVMKNSLKPRIKDRILAEAVEI